VNQRILGLAVAVTATLIVLVGWLVVDEMRTTGDAKATNTASPTPNAAPSTDAVRLRDRWAAAGGRRRGLELE
jgi:hypothetical protein